ncbi:hypothetical protein N7G274_008594 [Stereocaulon virgatum]|uniref:Uncharacterized protein n=1 Tax=Stereocaulon virgatum TaxID=373712 RepID=A0ABR3ZXX3_9LECA
MLLGMYPVGLSSSNLNPCACSKLPRYIRAPIRALLHVHTSISHCLVLRVYLILLSATPAERTNKIMPAYTILEARYVLRAKLDTLLRREFGSDYNVKIAGDQIEVTAPRKLSQVEIDGVTWTE